MTYSCKILLDSISETGKRITTMEITFPRCVLAEAETHRILRGWDGNIEEFIVHNLGINCDENLSRNSASSRAIPINKMIQKVRENPFIPEKWGKPVKGMGAKEYWPLDSIEHLTLTMNWTLALNNTLGSIEAAKDFGNKEDLSRLLEPFMYHTALITATEWDNFFKLRTNSAADWKIKRIADLMYEAYHAYDHWDSPTDAIITKFKDQDIPLQAITNHDWSAIRPQKLKVGEWHCPLVSEEDFLLVREWCVKNHPIFNIGGEHTRTPVIQDYIKKISVARCARVSYLTHDGKRSIEKDLELFERLRTSGHWSPFEHVAKPYFRVGNRNDWCGNFLGWWQYRKEFADENCTNFRKEN